MDGESLYAAVLQLFGESRDDEAAAVPSQACLHCDGRPHRAHHLTCDVEHQRYVLQHARSRSLACHFLYGAAEVEVDDVGTRLFHYPRSLHHGVCVAPVYLYAYGSFAVAYVEFAYRRFDGAHESFGTYKLGIHH